MAGIDKNNIRGIESSAKTAEPLCEYYGACGGCDLQHLSYKDQLLLKMERIQNIFAKFGSVLIHEIKGSPKEYYYRNRITLHHNKNEFGFFRALSHDIVPINKCVIASEIINEKLSQLNLDETLAGPESFELREDEASSFLQINTNQNQTLVEVVLGYCQGRKSQSVLELYCGLGNLTFPLAQQSKSILAIDGDDFAIDLAEQKRLQEGNKRIKFKSTPVYDELFSLSQDFKSFDLIVCDPPREGLRDAAKILPRLKAEKIIYVSCNLKTFVRDAKIIASKQYQLKEVQPIDMFPQTHHIEIVSVFTK